MAAHITPQDAEEICKRYIAAVEAGDLSAIDTLFTQDAIVRTPVSGHKPARAFYAYVFKAISDRKMKLLDVLVGISAPSRVALHMAYTRTVIGSPPATIETIDIFELTDRFDQISAVNIVYDTAPVRTDFETPKAQIDG
ncbi:nuclear transport factor 2 family protein [Roseibium alexandrii]